MERHATAALDSWIHSKRRKPLILRGARQVGKSTLVRLFARQQERVLNEVNLERHLSLETVFATLDLAAIRAELEALVGRSIAAPDTILFLDEIQATPSVLPALRYFNEDFRRFPLSPRVRCWSSPSPITTFPCRWGGSNITTSDR